MIETPSLSEHHKYAPVGRCIYCGATDCALTDEHTLPDGLGGRHILPKASCESCQKIINTFEQYCMRVLLANARGYFGVKANKKRPRPASTITIIKPGGEREEVERPIHELPLVVALPAFPMPTIMLGTQPTKGFMGGSWVPQPTNLSEKLAEFGAEAIETKDVNAGKLARLLAKIAHAHAVALLGLDGFKPLLPDLILGKRHLFIEFVGGDLNRHPPDPKHINRLALMYWRRKIDGKLFIAAEIRFFANLGGPIYYAVVGEPTEQALRAVPLPPQEDWELR